MGYESDLRNGKIERSNLEANKRFLDKVGLLRKKQKILEIGCGAGSMSAYLHEKGHDIIGIDISEVLLDYAKRKHKGCRFLLMGGESLEFEDGSFDAVISFDVLEHIPDVKRHVREVRRVLVKGGHYLFQTPNKWTNLPYCIVKDRSLTKWKAYHPSLQTKRSLRKLFRGWEVRFIDLDSYNDFARSKIPFNPRAFGITANYYMVARK